MKEKQIRLGVTIPEKGLCVVEVNPDVEEGLDATLAIAEQWLPQFKDWHLDLDPSKPESNRQAAKVRALATALTQLSIMIGKLWDTWTAERIAYVQDQQRKEREKRATD